MNEYISSGKCITQLQAIVTQKYFVSRMENVRPNGVTESWRHSNLSGCRNDSKMIFSRA